MPFWVVPAAIAAGQLIGGLIGQSRQNKANKKLAETQAAANESYLKQQLAYNTPKSQMQRFQDAGLNPNLVYGQGNPGNQSAPLSAPQQQPPDYQALGSNIGPLLNQSLMTQSQVQAIDAKTTHTYAMTALTQLQAQVVAKNPLLDTEGFKAIIDSLKSAASIKGSDATLKGIESGFQQMEGFGKWKGLKLGEHKLFRELELLDQKFNLGNLDAKIKAEVINSKEFQNTLLEIQKNWMADGQITPQHILQFIQLFLLKMF